MTRPRVATPAGLRSTPERPTDAACAPDPCDSPASTGSPDQLTPRPEAELPPRAGDPNDVSVSCDKPDLLTPRIPHPLLGSDTSDTSATSDNSHKAYPSPGLSVLPTLSTVPDPSTSSALSTTLTLNASPMLSTPSSRYALPTLSASANPHDPGHSDLIPPRTSPDHHGSRGSREPLNLLGQPTRVATQGRVQAPRTPQPRSGLPRSGGPGRNYSGSVTRTYSANQTNQANRPRPYRASYAGSRPLTYGKQPAGANNLGPLTGLGVSLVLGAGCACGALLDMLLVGGPAWALAVMYVAACGYTATRVRRADWFSALVSPPLAFAAAVVMLATLMPSSFGPGALGVLATTFTLLAAKAKALYIGNAVSAGILLSRRVKARRPIPKPRPAS